MKVLFLDIDGCVLSAKNLRKATAMKKTHAWLTLDIVKPEIEPLFDRLEREVPGVILVISSAWRKFCTKDEMQEHLNEAGIKQVMHEEWKTKDVMEFCSKEEIQILNREFNVNRGLEIQEWLANHDEITNYVILDDDSDMLEIQKEKFVHVEDGIEGLKDFHMDRVIQILKQE